ncbi:MAG: restriction endonuclease [Candidatus Jordarchaeales archaeon]
METVVRKLLSEFLTEDELSDSWEARIVVNSLLERGVLLKEGDKLIAPDRVSLVEALLSYGFTAEYLARLLTWKAFEEFLGGVFDRHGYSLIRNFRFSRSGRRFEVDILALKKPLVICVECKHYKRPRTVAPDRRILERHAERTKALADSIPGLSLELGVSGWGKIKVLPLVVTLLQEGFYRKIPVVPVFKLNSFLLELDANIDLMCCFEAVASNYLKIM